MPPGPPDDSYSNQVFIKTTPVHMFGQNVGHIFNSGDLSKNHAPSTYSLLEPQLPDIEVSSLSYTLS